MLCYGEGVKMKIRKAIEKDIERINEICKEGLIQEHTLQDSDDGKKIKEDVEYDFSFHKKTIRKNLKEKTQYWIVLEENGVIIGFGSAYTKGRNKGVVESVYVARVYQRKGYGTVILENLIKWIKSKKVKHIETNALIRNEPSIKLHEKLGFEPYMLRMRLR